MFPLSTVLFPGGDLPLHVFEPRYRALTETCLAGDREFGVVLISRGAEVGGGDQRVAVGTVARIEGSSSTPDGRWALLARGTRRIRVLDWLAEDHYPTARIEHLDPGDGHPADGAGLEAALAAVRRTRALLSELGETAPMPAESELADLAAAGALAWRLCDLAPVNLMDRQRLLETVDPAARAALLVSLCDDLAGDLARLLAGG